MGLSSMPRIERLNFLFGGLLVIACALLTRRDQALGAAVGVVLTCLNFAFMNRLIGRWIEDAKRGDGAGSSRIALIMPKMVLLMGAVVLCLAFLPIDPVFFVVEECVLAKQKDRLLKASYKAEEPFPRLDDAKRAPLDFELKLPTATMRLTLSVLKYKGFAQ